MHPKLWALQMGFLLQPGWWSLTSHWGPVCPPFPSCASRNLFQTFAEQTLCLLLNPQGYVIAEEWWTRGGRLARMRGAASGRQERCKPSSPIQPCPSVGAALQRLAGYCWVLKGCLLPWAGACCSLVSAKVNRQAQRRHLCNSHWDRNKSIIISTEISTQAPRTVSPVKFMSACLLNLPVADLICYVFCFLFLFPLCVTCFPFVSPLHLLPPALPWCSAWRGIKTAEECKWCGVHVDFFFFRLMLASAKWSLKRRKKGCWSISAQVGAGSPELAWSRSSSCVSIHAGWYLNCAQRPPIGPIALWTKPFSCKSVCERQT